MRLTSSAQLPVLEQRRRGTRFLAHAARSVINPPESTGIGCWSLNPYVGCEFGCAYCYARFAHRYVVERARDAGHLTPEEFGRLRGLHGWDGFEHQIFVKERTALLGALERDLARVLARYRRGRREPVLIGTATDPYQPAERRFGITRAVLERLAQAPPLDIGLITKSPLVARDAALLARLATRHRLTVHLSLISTRRRLIRIFEPRSPMPHARLRAVRQHVAAGVHAGLLVAPILPGITDRTAHLRQLLRAAREHQACCAHPSPLRLYAAVRPVLLPVLQRQFPTLVPRYLAAYRRAENAPSEYARGLKDRFARLAVEIGIDAHDDRFGDDAQRPGMTRQLALWNNTPAEEP
jgi:DNA repair photolyase